MIDWNEYHKQIGATLGELMKLSPDTVRGYQTLSAANSKTGKLATTEEIAEALGVAVAMNAGAALIYSTRVLDAVNAKSAQVRTA